MEKMDVASLDIENIEMEKLKSVFPQCFVEGKLNVDKLLNLCGEYIDNDYEKYEFSWKGKVESLKNAQTRSVGTLRPCVEESKNFDDTENLYIEGDNLEVLKLLQHSYYNKVKMIYIDPPYNTGNDFVYKDDFRDSIANYKEITGQATKSNPEYTGRFHTDWLNMIYPRLRLAYNLLRDDGVIFISIDDNEQANLKKVCDEVFGEENFVAQIIWEKKYSPQNDAKWFSPNHDYILVYAKNKYIYRPILLERTEEQNARYKNPDNDPRGPWKMSDLSVKTYSAEYDYPITTPSGRVVDLPAGRCWMTNKNKMQELIDDNRIWFGEKGENVPALKRFLTDVKQGVTPMTIWGRNEVGDNQEAKKVLLNVMPENVFQTPKSIRLIKKMLKLTCKNDDIILDFFSGSATTAHAVMELNAEDGGNRKYIMVQLPELVEETSEAYKSGYKNICEIGKERIRRAGAKIEENLSEKNSQLSIEDGSNPISVDTGFKVFKLDTSNFKVWDNSGVDEEDIDLLQRRLEDMVEEKKDERSDLDIVYEVMLKVGVPLTEKVIPTEITATSVDGVTSSKKIYVVREDCLLIVCLEKGVLKEHVVEMLAYDPATIVFSESSFGNTEEIVNAKLAMEDVYGFENKENVRFMYV